MSDRVIITSGLSKAFGIPGVRIGWIVGPEAFIRECWSDHDYITICPNKLSDKIARVVLSETNRERCLARTREVLKNNLPIVRSWAQGLSPILEWQEPEAGAFTLFKYNLDIPSRTLGERIRQNQNTLIVPGAMMGLERHIRVSLGAKEEYLRAGLDRIGRELQKIAKGQ